MCENLGTGFLHETLFPFSTPTPEPMNTLTVHNESMTNGLRPEHVKRVKENVRNAASKSTLDTYRKLWNAFTGWCEAANYRALPASPETVAAYLSDCADRGLSVSTCKTARAAIGFVHREADKPDPTAHNGVKKVLRGISRAGRTRGQRQAAPFRQTELAAIIATAYTPRPFRNGYESKATAERRGRVDVALARVMWIVALRRSEVCELRWTDFEREPDGSGRLHLRFRKTDQEGKGTWKFLSPPTVRALDAIRGFAKDGYIFPIRTGHGVAKRIKAMCAAAGLEGAFSGHSPRVGMAQDLYAKGATILQLQTECGWSSPDMPARYTRKQATERGAIAEHFRNA